MPRQLRQFKVGNIYHVINRGVEKRKIFMKPQDYSRFILGLEFFNSHQPFNFWTDLLDSRPTSFRRESVTPVGSDPTGVTDWGRAAKTEDLLSSRIKNLQLKMEEPLVELLAFTLMSNHYHLVLREVIRDGISIFMKKMGGYSAYFNKQYGRVGPLFQSRFRCVLI